MSLSDFLSLGSLGSGGYSSVIKAQRKKDGKVYAVKQIQGLTKKDRTDAVNEVRLLASFRHPNIIAYREAFLDAETQSLCIVMEYADGGDLYQRIVQRRSQSFTEEFIWNLLVQLARALSAIHKLNVVHRDIKSANVFLFTDGAVKLGDFNISKVAKQGLLFTQTGTPYYASPEVWKEHPYTAKSDIWSLGCVIYEAAALRLPFHSKNMEVLYHQVTKGEYPPLPPHFSYELVALLSRLLQVDPDKRPSSEEILRFPEVYKRVPYVKDLDGRCSLLEMMYAEEEFTAANVRNWPRERYGEGRERKQKLPALYPQIASVFRTSPVLKRKTSFSRSRKIDRSADRFREKGDREEWKSHYGALQPLRHQAALHDSSIDAIRSSAVSDRYDQIFDNYQRAKAAIDLIASPNKRRSGNTTNE